ncbi:AMP-binding protein [Gilvimarinus sp. 1_MG-2023]|uniref:AMP-binding protein n=1 Tax=Gilvimarinus sp. 1_MG-2023 TaxID=3062638 RepID=UPI0026E3E288|nr:AMP-binding protein [Gilvimarinus sp. 1_MG-2023]MDO6748501.1 AMP-binding protein [Gilvimarinus sp. 1_MG-2023]
MSTSFNIGSLALQGGAHCVALDAQRRYSADDLKLRVEALYQSLVQKDEHHVGVWLTNPWDFLCVFIALALAGKRIVMPHNLQAGTADCLGQHFSALISDDPALALHSSYWQLEQLLAETDNPADLGEQDINEQVELVLFTSGTTSTPQPIAKTFADLHCELAELQQVFADAVAQHPVLATVSHQHIYGLLHFLLWPLARRAPIMLEAGHYPEVLAGQVAQLAPVVLVSSPTHLSRLPQTPVFCQQAEGLAAIFSSGGLLAETDAQAMANIVGHAPWEILGSTETGGVAYRRRSESSFWAALPGVEVEPTAEGQLRVRSAHLGGLHEFVMGDKVEFLADGRFHLLGRADTVVKVEGKRLSLSEMEARLSEHPWVQESRVAVVRGRRDEVGMVVALSEVGLSALHNEKKLFINTTLKNHLSTYFERPLLPRRWRYFTTLPRNNQGKVVAATIQQLLSEREH